MKKAFYLVIVFLFFATSCCAQKLVQKTSDAKKIEINKDRFIGKPLKELLAEIEPQIKFVYGNPENKWAGAVGGTYFKFHFVNKEDYEKSLKKNKTPIGIVITFQLETDSNRMPLPKGGLKEWTTEQTKEYGDMIITKIRVIGEEVKEN